MRSNFSLLVLMLAALLSACANSPSNTRPSNVASAATPVPTASVPKNGDYPGRGKVTKINNELGSVELDHEEIVGVMPKMTMEFFVTDKSMLKPFNVGDAVEFTLRYRDGQETIIAIEKSE